jgi:hypothetical protein
MPFERAKVFYVFVINGFPYCVKRELNNGFDGGNIVIKISLKFISKSLILTLIVFVAN